MTIYLYSSDKHRNFCFPISTMRLGDVLDRINIQSGAEVRFRFPRYEFCDLPDCVLDRHYTADIYKLNLFVDRYEQLEDGEKAVFKSVLLEHSHSTIDDMLMMTYGIENVTVFPCYNAACLGEIAVKNKMMPEFKDYPNELVKFLDYDKIGKTIIERGEGVIVDEYFCKPKEYRRPDIEVEIAPPEKKFFRLLVSPSVSDIDIAQWVSLLEDEAVLNEMSQKIGLPLEALYYAEIESALPAFSDDSYKNDDCIHDMIRLSKKLADLPHHRLVKLKAIMEAKDICVIGGVFDAIDSLDEYDFDPMVQDEQIYSKVVQQNVREYIDTMAKPTASL